MMDRRDDRPVDLSHTRRIIVPLAYIGGILALIGALISGAIMITKDRAGIDASIYQLSRDVLDGNRENARELASLKVQLSSYEAQIRDARTRNDQRLSKVEDIYGQVQQLTRDMDQVKRDMASLRKQKSVATP